MTPALTVAPFAGEAAEWDAFVRSQAGWTHFHLYGWRRVIETVFGHECVFLAARDAGGRLAGVLPLVRVRSALFGHFLVSMPFVSYGGPLGGASAERALMDDAESRASGTHVKLLQIRARRALETALPVGHQKLTVVIDIPEGGPDALFKQLGNKMRTKIRKPQKEGVEVRWGRDQLEPFHRILARSMRDLGTPVQSQRFYEVIADTFPESTWFACGYLDGEPVSGGCGFIWDREMEITWSSSLRLASGIRPGYFLHWCFLERAAQEGCTIANFGRSTPNSGTHEYKQQWGGRDEPLWWYYRSADGKVSTPNPDDGAYSMGPRVWKKLPVGVATWLGPRIVRYIP